MWYSRTDIDRIKAGVDLVTLVSRYVDLRASGRGYVGCCPFHEDHDPSFRVDPKRQAYRCFGCGERGDAVRFLRRIEQLDFREAVEHLQKLTATTPKIAPFTAAPALPPPSTGRSPTSPPSRVRDALMFAHLFFRQHLAHSRLAREYLCQRGVGPDRIRRYQLGYAPPGRRHLLYAAERAGFEIDLLIEVGLIAKKQNGVPYDFFRNRIMFPLCCSSSDNAPTLHHPPSGFAGRTLPRPRKRSRPSRRSHHTPRYLNTPAHCFSDPAPWFGWKQAVSRLYDLNLIESESLPVVVVEGFFDVLLTDSVLPFPVLGLCGTELTRLHVERLRDLVKSVEVPSSIQVLMMFDGDTSGQAALTRALETISTQAPDLKRLTCPVVLPDGLDPAELVQHGGPGAFQRLVTASRSPGHPSP